MRFEIALFSYRDFNKVNNVIHRAISRTLSTFQKGYDTCPQFAQLSISSQTYERGQMHCNMLQMQDMVDYINT